VRVTLRSGRNIPEASELISLRESEIKPAFPESPLENGLLRRSLLDEFVQTRPKTRGDRFGKIPHHLRSSVDSRQVGKYLDRVLEIIAESEGESRPVDLLSIVPLVSDQICPASENVTAFCSNRC
jgi:hypothetical protein